MPFHIVLFLILIPAIPFVCVPIPYICLSQDTKSLLHVRPNGTNGDSLQVLRFIPISSEALHGFFLLAKKHVEFPQCSVNFLSSYWIVGQNALLYQWGQVLTINTHILKGH